MSDDSDDDETFMAPVDNLKEETLMQATTTDVGVEPSRAANLTVYDIDGVEHVVLDEEAQVAVGVAIGPDITGEQPWKTVDKELILDHIEAMGMESPFAVFRTALDALDSEEVLMGYILDESRDTDEYYICLTNEAKVHCNYQAEKFIRKQARKLEKSVLKKSNPWTSLGSDLEVDENIPVKNRPLIKIKIKSQYPFANQPERFQVRNTDAVRDGFAELVPSRAKFSNVFKKRIDAAVQANPSRIDAEAQTIPRFPHNVWTQASVEAGEYKQAPDKSAEEPEEEAPVKPTKAAMQSTKKSAKEIAAQKTSEFMKQNAPALLEIVHFNSTVDIYNIDYPNLCSENNTASKVFEMTFKDYLCFTDYKAKDKYIAFATFHPLWTGIIAVGYSDTTTCLITKVNPTPVDNVNRAVYGDNPVMIWSLSDSLRPQLYLESNREVRMLSWCPYNENILVGSCINGQIIVWDLSGKLAALQEMEILTEAQEKNRTAINSQMGWLKKVHSKSVVRAVAVSNLQFDHQSTATDISWISPNFEISKSGKPIHLRQHTGKAMQFLSVSEDGTVLFWSLKLSGALSSGEPKKSSRRTKGKKAPTPIPPDLMVETSPYKQFDGVLKPLFKIIIGQPNVAYSTPLTAVSHHKPPVYYRKLNITEKDGRQLFEPVILEEESMNSTLWLATMYGETIHMQWVGSQIVGEGKINNEYSKILSRCKIHNGPIVCTRKNPFCDEIVVTLGGRIFSIWHSQLPNKPLLWKVRPANLTDGTWSKFKPSQLLITTSDGSVEVWDFLRRSDAPIRTQNISGNMLTAITMHKLPMDKNILAVADLDASLRLFTIPEVLTEVDPEDVERTRHFFYRELEIKAYYENWQEKWLQKNAAFVAQKKKEEKAATDETLKDVKVKQVHSRGDTAKKPKSAKKKFESKEQERESRWRKLQWDAIEKTMETMKQLNVAELVKQEKPLRDLEAQKRERLRQKVEILKRRTEIFDEAVSILFPEALAEAIPPPAPISKDVIAERNKKYIDEYAFVALGAEKYLDSHPYEYEFDWKHTIIDGKERRMGLDTGARKYFEQRDSIEIEEESSTIIEAASDENLENADDADQEARPQSAVDEEQAGQVEEHTDA